MKWEALFNSQRLGSSNKQRDISSSGNRSSFVKDYDRLIFSSPFRRLQNKTQVFPLPVDIFVHNRLTHSLEVASVGRSLGNIAGQKIIEKHQPDKKSEFYHFYDYELQNVIATACLSHDIGNPPFGHAGEEAISQFFRDLGKDNFDLTEQQWTDLQNFEGNANGFRILTKGFKNSNNEYKLTYTSIASMIKYPCNSIHGNDKTTGLISTKKYGFFETETAAFNKVVEVFNLPLLKKNSTIHARHPFVYLVEAADDICYLVIDMEDAFNIGIISEDSCTEILLNFIKEEEGYFSYENTCKKLNDIALPEQKIAFLRAVVINVLIKESARIFLEEETSLLSGELNGSLADYFHPHIAKAFKALKIFSVKNIYKHPSVVEREIGGFTAINSLLQTFITAIQKPDSSKSKLIRSIIPQKHDLDAPLSDYEKLRNLLDYVSLMTDLQAVQTYKKINGLL